MKFEISDEFFRLLPDACFSIVAAVNTRNDRPVEDISNFLENASRAARMLLGMEDLKEDPSVLVYREAFRTLGINPNRYPCSVEALLSRITQGKEMPSISPLVDLGNAISIKYRLPVGAHDMGDGSGTLTVRPAADGDTFLPFGGGEEEQPDPGEIIYAVGSQVRTRRWTWRQSEHGRITKDTRFVLYPIDGFESNRRRLIAARNELARRLKYSMNCDVEVGWLDKENPVFNATI